MSTRRQRPGRSGRIRRGPGGRIGVGDGGRTAALAGAGGPSRGWVLPWWLARQSDPASPAFVPLGPLGRVPNLTGRRATRLAALAGRTAVSLDPCGLVTPDGPGWSLDWWVGAEDHWHVPGTDPTTRQSSLRWTPVVETRLRVPGGDVAQRAAVVVAADGSAHLVLEVDLESPVPVALALAVRPYGPDGFAPVRRIERRGVTVTVDGRAALLLPRPPNQETGAAGRGGLDSATTVLSGATPAAGAAFAVEDPSGLAQAAFVYPLTKGSPLRFVLPLGAGGAAAASGRSVDLRALPEPAKVANGWVAQSDRGLRVVLPDVRLQQAFDTSRRHLLALHALPDATAPAAGPGADQGWLGFPAGAAEVVAALGDCGFHDEAAAVLARFPEPGRAAGARSSAPGPSPAATFLWALEHHVARTGRAHPFPDPAAALAALVEAAARSAQRAPGAAARGAPTASDPTHATHLWASAAAASASRMLRDLGEEAAASQAHALAGTTLDAARAAMAAGSPAAPAPVAARPGWPFDSRSVDVLAAVAPLGLLPPDDPLLSATADGIRAGWTAGAAVVASDGTGLDPAATAALAAYEVRAGDQRALERVEWLLSVASPTWTWPDRVHPRLKTGSAGEGHSGTVTAAVVSLVRSLLLREEGDGLVLLPLVAAAWLGQGIEVHDAPTRHGVLSFAVRWHGERPALLWELEPVHEAPVVLTVPGLDAGFRTAQPRGEALLAAPEP